MGLTRNEFYKMGLALERINVAKIRRKIMLASINFTPSSRAYALLSSYLMLATEATYPKYSFPLNIDNQTASPYSVVSDHP